MAVRVWMESWQQECCGPPFAVGNEVEWPVAEPPRPDWLPGLLGNAAPDLDYTADRHDVAEHVDTLRGSVQAIQLLRARFQPSASDRHLFNPTPGSGVLERIEAVTPDVEGSTGGPSGQLMGYLVEVEPATSAEHRPRDGIKP